VGQQGAGGSRAPAAAGCGGAWGRWVHRQWAKNAQISYIKNAAVSPVSRSSSPLRPGRQERRHRQPPGWLRPR